MSARTGATVRLEPMAEGDFQRSLQRAIPRHAADAVRRGLWTQDRSLEASADEFNQLLPNGRETPGKRFANVVDVQSGRIVGETWYTVETQGGKARFWIDWIWVDPERRRNGYAESTLRLLEEEARRQGADRVGLSVWFDNAAALALYAKLGFTATDTRMTKPVRPLR